MFEFAFEAAIVLIEQADQRQSVLDKLDDLQDLITDVEHRIDEVDQHIGNIENDIKSFQSDLFLKLDLEILDTPYSRIQTWYHEIQRKLSAEGREDLARTVLANVPGERDMVMNALEGSLPSQMGKSIVRAQLEHSGTIPRHFTETMFRLVAMAETTISWAYMQLNRVTGLQSNRAVQEPKSQQLWSKIEADVFYMVRPCQWDNDDVALSCGSSEIVTSFVQHDGQNASLDVANSAQKIPNTGCNHPEWDYHLKCPVGARVVGMKGFSDHPAGHGKDYVSGFQLYCSDGTTTDKTTRYDYSLSKADNPKHFDFMLGSALRKIRGCTHVPTEHSISYWGAGAELSGIATDSPTHKIPGVDACLAPSAPHYSLDCGDGLCVHSVEGCSDLPMKDSWGEHVVSYIATATFYCYPCYDFEKDVQVEHNVQVV